MFGSYGKSAIKSDFVSNKLWKRSVTINILIIISLSFSSAVKSFYLPPLIFVLNHMCLLLGPLFHLTKADARSKEEECEKVCGRLFHLNNCWLWQKCPISYSILRGMLLKHDYHWIYEMRGWDHLNIPHICQFWGTTALFRPVKVHRKCINLR